MKNRSSKIILTAGLVFAAYGLHAQTSSGGSNYLLYILLSLAVLIFFLMIIQVSDNLLSIKAKRLGTASGGAGFSLFPAWSGLVSGKNAGYPDGSAVHSLNRGFNIPLKGEATLQVDSSAKATTFAVQRSNFRGLSPIPKVVVQEGQEVKAGDVLFFDKNLPEIKYCAPVSGEVIAVRRGEKRSIAEVVILADKEIRYRELPAFDLEGSTREQLVEFLLESGAWPMLIQRPFDIVPGPGDVPRDVFISTFDTAPLAPDLNFVVEGRGEAFQKGLEVLARLTPGKVYLGLDARAGRLPSPVFTEAKGVVKHWFKGKHPAGNVGVQIHHIRPIGHGEKVWTVGVQEVITLGALFTERRFNTERVVALTGAELKSPAYVRTCLGANIGELVRDNLNNDHVRLVSGDVLTGAPKTSSGFLNFHDDQVTALLEGDYYEMFGWLLPVKPRPSISRTYPNYLLPGRRFRADTNTHGEKRAFVVTGQYEEVLPMDVYPQLLMKAILSGDFERMEGLGILELNEEDIALCEFVCTSKQPLQQILRRGLDMMKEQA